MHVNIHKLSGSLASAANVRPSPGYRKSKKGEIPNAIPPRKFSTNHSKKQNYGLIQTDGKRAGGRVTSRNSYVGRNSLHFYNNRSTMNSRSGSSRDLFSPGQSTSRVPSYISWTSQSRSTLPVNRSLFSRSRRSLNRQNSSNRDFVPHPISSQGTFSSSNQMRGRRPSFVGEPIAVRSKPTDLNRKINTSQKPRAKDYFKPKPKSPLPGKDLFNHQKEYIPQNSPEVKNEYVGQPISIRVKNDESERNELPKNESIGDTSKKNHDGIIKKIKSSIENIHPISRQNSKRTLSNIITQFHNDQPNIGDPINILPSNNYPLSKVEPNANYKGEDISSKYQKRKSIRYQNINENDLNSSVSKKDISYLHHHNSGRSKKDGNSLSTLDKYPSTTHKVNAEYSIIPPSYETLSRRDSLITDSKNSRNNGRSMGSINEQNLLNKTSKLLIEQLSKPSPSNDLSDITHITPQKNFASHPSQMNNLTSDESKFNPTESPNWEGAMVNLWDPNETQNLEVERQLIYPQPNINNGKGLWTGNKTIFESIDNNPSTNEKEIEKNNFQPIIRYGKNPNNNPLSRTDGTLTSGNRKEIDDVSATSKISIANENMENEYLKYLYESWRKKKKKSLSNQSLGRVKCHDSIFGGEGEEQITAIHEFPDQKPLSCLICGVEDMDGESDKCESLFKQIVEMLKLQDRMNEGSRSKMLDAVLKAMKAARLANAGPKIKKCRHLVNVKCIYYGNLLGRRCNCEKKKSRFFRECIHNCDYRSGDYHCGDNHCGENRNVCFIGPNDLPFQRTTTNRNQSSRPSSKSERSYRSTSQNSSVSSLKEIRQSKENRYRKRGRKYSSDSSEKTFQFDQSSDSYKYHGNQRKSTSNTSLLSIGNDERSFCRSSQIQKRYNNIINNYNNNNNNITTNSDSTEKFLSQNTSSSRNASLTNDKVLKQPLRCRVNGNRKRENLIRSNNRNNHTQNNWNNKNQEIKELSTTQTKMRNKVRKHRKKHIISNNLNNNNNNVKSSLFSRQRNIIQKFRDIIPRIKDTSSTRTNELSFSSRDECRRTGTNSSSNRLTESSIECSERKISEYSSTDSAYSFEVTQLVKETNYSSETESSTLCSPSNIPSTDSSNSNRKLSRMRESSTLSWNDFRRHASISSKASPVSTENEIFESNSSQSRTDRKASPTWTDLLKNSSTTVNTESRFSVTSPEIGQRSKLSETGSITSFNSTQLTNQSIEISVEPLTKSWTNSEVDQYRSSISSQSSTLKDTMSERESETSSSLSEQSNRFIETVDEDYVSSSTLKPLSQSSLTDTNRTSSTPFSHRTRSNRTSEIELSSTDLSETGYMTTPISSRFTSVNCKTKSINSIDEEFPQSLTTTQSSREHSWVNSDEMELHTTPTTFQSVGRIPLTPETQSVISKDVSIHSNSSRGNRRSLRSVILSKSPTKSSSVSREIEDGTSIDFSKNDSPTSPVEPGRFLKFLKSIQRSIINIESDTENQSISTEHGESVRRPLQSIRYRNSETDPTTLYDSDVTLLSKSINVPKLTTETEESETNTINSNNESGDRNNSANLLSINWRSSQTNDTSVWTPQPESNFKFSESSSAKFSKLTDDPSEISRSYQRESNVSSTLTNCSKISSPFSPGERRTNVSTMQSSKHSWRDTEKLEEREYFSSNSSKLNHSSSETPLATSSSAIEYINPSIVDYKTESPTLRQSSDYVSSDEKIQYNKIPTSSKPPRRLVSDINTSTSVDVAQQSNRRSLNYPKSMSRSSWKNFNKSSSTLPKDISNTESLPGFTQNTISEQLFNTSMTSEGIRSSSESEFKNFSDSSETKNFGEISSRNKSTLPTTHIEITHSSPRTISEMTTPSILVRPRKNFITSSENESNIKVFRKIGTESISSINSSQSTSHRTKISQSIITSQEESIESRKYNSLLEREENSFDTQSILDKRNISTTDLPLLSSDSQLFTQSSRNFNNESDNSSTLTPSFEVKFNDISLRSKYIVPDDTDMWTDVSKLRLDKSSQSSRQTYLTSSKSTNLTQLENESIIADLSWANERDISSQNSIINSSLYKTDNSSSKESTNIEQQFDTTSTTPTLKSLNSTFKPGSTYSSYERTKYSGEADSNISYSWTEDLTNLRDISNSPTLITDPSRIFISPLNSSIITSRNNSNDSSTHQRRSVELSSGRSANELDSSQSISESGISLSRLSNTVTHSSNISSNSSDDMWRNSENERSKQTSATIQLETVPSSLFPQSTNSLEAIISQSTWPTISDVIDKKSSSSKRSWTSSEVNSSISSMTLVPASDSLRTINDNSSSMIPKSSNTSLTSNENEISKSQSQTSSNRNSSSGNPLNSDSSQTIHDEQTILNESSIEFDIDDNQSTSVRNSMTSSLLLDLPKKLMCEISELENSCLFAELTKYLASHDIEVRNGEKMNKDIF